MAVLPIPDQLPSGASRRREDTFILEQQRQVRLRQEQRQARQAEQDAEEVPKSNGPSAAQARNIPDPVERFKTQMMQARLAQQQQEDQRQLLAMQEVPILSKIWKYVERGLNVFGYASSLGADGGVTSTANFVRVFVKYVWRPIKPLFTSESSAKQDNESAIMTLADRFIELGGALMYLTVFIVLAICVMVLLVAAISGIYAPLSTVFGLMSIYLFGK